MIEGKSRREIREEEQASWEDVSVEEHVAMYEKQGYSRKDAMKLAAKDRGMTKRDIYQMLLQ